MDKFIQRPLTRAQINEVLEFLSYHLNYYPPNKLNMIFAKTPKQFARLHGKDKQAGLITSDEINTEVPAFFDHITNTIVFQAFSFIEGVTVPTFIMPMTTVIHECIHFYQYSSGTYGSWKTMYEGTNEILSCFFSDDYEFDYNEEAIYAFNLIMALNNGNFWEAINWMKHYTTHSDKNTFVTRSILQSTVFAKFRPSNLMRWLDANTLHKIKNEDVRILFTKYGRSQIKKQLHKNRQLIS
jgi:hypothetical protein